MTRELAEDEIDNMATADAAKWRALVRKFGAIITAEGIAIENHIALLRGLATATACVIVTYEETFGLDSLVPFFEVLEHELKSVGLSERAGQSVEARLSAVAEALEERAALDRLHS